jgi:hypothetical protein
MFKQTVGLEYIVTIRDANECKDRESLNRDACRLVKARKYVMER